jgi:membrane protein implicated in regulation of membrane protease activity
VEALEKQPIWEDLDNPIIQVIAAAIFVFASLLLLGSYWKLVKKKKQNQKEKNSTKQQRELLARISAIILVF